MVTKNPRLDGIDNITLSSEEIADDYVDKYDISSDAQKFSFNRNTGPYSSLEEVLEDAYEQAAFGKGKERHANGKPFDRQPIMEIGRMVGLGYPTGQAQKKLQEAVGMFNRGEHDAAIAEILGAINYAAAAVMLIREA